MSFTKLVRMDGAEKVHFYVQTCNTFKGQRGLVLVFPAAQSEGPNSHLVPDNSYRD